MVQAKHPAALPEQAAASSSEVPANKSLIFLPSPHSPCAPSTSYLRLRALCYAIAKLFKAPYALNRRPPDSHWPRRFIVAEISDLLPCKGGQACLFLPICWSSHAYLGDMTWVDASGL